MQNSFFILVPLQSRMIHRSDTKIVCLNIASTRAVLAHISLSSKSWESGWLCCDGWMKASSCYRRLSCFSCRVNLQPYAYPRQATLFITFSLFVHYLKLLNKWCQGYVMHAYVPLHLHLLLLGYLCRYMITGYLCSSTRAPAKIRQGEWFCTLPHE